MCCEEELLSAGSGADEREIADGQDIENPAVWGGDSCRREFLFRIHCVVSGKKVYTILIHADAFPL